MAWHFKGYGHFRYTCTGFSALWLLSALWFPKRSTRTLIFDSVDSAARAVKVSDPAAAVAAGVVAVAVVAAASVVASAAAAVVGTVQRQPAAVSYVSVCSAASAAVVGRL